MINHPIRHYHRISHICLQLARRFVTLAFQRVSQLIEFACTVATTTTSTTTTKETETDRKCQASGNVKTKVKRHRHLKSLSA